MGYSWNDGLGLSLASRAYNNWATYFLVFKFGQLRLVVLAYICWLTAIVVVGYEYLSMEVFVIITFFMLSPLLIQSYFNLGKPEVVWWFLIPLVAFYSLSHNFYIAALIWSVIAMVNAAMAFLIAIILISPMMLISVVNDGFSIDLIVAVFFLFPGLLKLCFRLLYMYNSGFLKIIGNEQKGLWKKGWLDFSSDFVTYFIVICSLYLLFYERFGSISFAIYALFMLVPYYLNFRLVYLNDYQSYFIIFLSSLIAFSLSLESNEALFVSCLLAFRIVFVPSDISMVFKTSSNLSSIIKSFFDVSKTFPFKDLIECKDLEIKPLYKVFESLKSSSRILIITETKLRQSIYRKEIEISRSKIISKDIFLLNDMYGGMQSRFISDFDANKLMSLDSNDVIRSFELLLIDNLITFDHSVVEYLCSTNRFVLTPLAIDGDYYVLEFLHSEPEVSIVCSAKGKFTFLSNVSGEVIIPFYFERSMSVKDECENVIDYKPSNEVPVFPDVSFFKVKVEKNKFYTIFTNGNRFIY